MQLVAKHYGIIIKVNINVVVNLFIKRDDQKQTWIHKQSIKEAKKS